MKKSISKLKSAGMIPALHEDEVPPNFNTQEKTAGCP
jgi:hypothetical protein